MLCRYTTSSTDSTIQNRYSSCTQSNEFRASGCRKHRVIRSFQLLDQYSISTLFLGTSAKVVPCDSKIASVTARDDIMSNCGLKFDANDSGHRHLPPPHTTQVAVDKPVTESCGGHSSQDDDKASGESRDEHFFIRRHPSDRKAVPVVRCSESVARCSVKSRNGNENDLYDQVDIADKREAKTCEELTKQVK